jgi:DNA-binding GntR family transcriptional regulator
MANVGPGSDQVSQPLSKTDYVLQRLREEIADGTLNTGEPLKQTDLARRYGVSPTPVREALRLLEAEKTINYSPHHGATVAEMSSEGVSDLYRLRAASESLATRIAVERFNEETVARITSLHQALSEGRSTLPAAQLSQLNKQLHFAIYSSGSPEIVSHIESIWRLIPAAVTLWSRPSYTRVLVAQHARIIDAVVARDADAAAELMSEHVLTSARFRQERQSAQPGEIT